MVDTVSRCLPKEMGASLRPRREYPVAKLTKRTWESLAPLGEHVAIGKGSVKEQRTARPFG